MEIVRTTLAGSWLTIPPIRQIWHQRTSRDTPWPSFSLLDFVSLSLLNKALCFRESFYLGPSWPMAIYPIVGNFIDIYGGDQLTRLIVENCELIRMPVCPVVKFWGWEVQVTGEKTSEGNYSLVPPETERKGEEVSIIINWLRSQGCSITIGWTKRWCLWSILILVSKSEKIIGRRWRPWAQNWWIFDQRNKPLSIQGQINQLWKVAIISRERK